MLFVTMSGRCGKERMRQIPSYFCRPSASLPARPCQYRPPPSSPVPETSRTLQGPSLPKSTQLSPTPCHAYSYQHLLNMYRLYPLHQMREKKVTSVHSPFTPTSTLRHVVVSHPHKTNELHTVASCFLEPIKSLSAPSSRPIRLLLSPPPPPPNPQCVVPNLNLNSSLAPKDERYPNNLILPTPTPDRQACRPHGSASSWSRCRANHVDSFSPAQGSLPSRRHRPGRHRPGRHHVHGGHRHVRATVRKSHRGQFPGCPCGPTRIRRGRGERHLHGGCYSCCHHRHWPWGVSARC